MPEQRHVFEVEMPDSSILEIDAPENTPQDQIRSRAKQYWDTTGQHLANQAWKFPASETGKAVEAPWYSAFLRQGRDENASAGRVASDRAADVLTGIPGAVTGIPGMISEGVGIAKDALSGNAMGVFNRLKGAGTGMTAPIVTPVKQAIELAAPGLVDAPTPDSPQAVAAAQGAGTVLGGAIVAGATPHVIKAATPIVNKAGNVFNQIKSKPMFQPTIEKPAVPATPKVPAVPLDAAKVNKWMGVASREVEYGSNPGQQLMDDGLIGATKEATKANVKKALDAAGQQMEKGLEAAGKKGITIDAQTPVYDSAAKAVKRIGSPRDSAFQAQIDGIVDDIESRYGNLDKLSPADAHRLKVELGDSIDWHGEAFNNPVNQTMVRIYRSINDLIKSEVPGIDALQTKWGNLYSAAKNLHKGMAKDVVGTGTGAAAPTTIPEVPEVPGTPAQLGRSPASKFIRTTAKRVIPPAVGAALGVRYLREFIP